MIEVRRVAEGDHLNLEVVVKGEQGETCHHVTMSRDTNQRLTAGKHTPEQCVEAAFPFPGRPRTEGVYSSTLLCGGDLAILPRIRTRAVTLPLAVLMKLVS